MSNNCLSVENKNVVLKVCGGGGHKHTIAPPPPIKNVGGSDTGDPVVPMVFTKLDEIAEKKVVMTSYHYCFRRFNGRSIILFVT